MIKILVKCSSEFLCEASVLIMVFGFLDRYVANHQFNAGYVAGIVITGILSFFSGYVFKLLTKE